MCGTLIGMTEKAAFNAEEWSKLVEAPALAALRVVAADRGGTIRESLSLGRAYAEAREEGGGLLGEIASTPPHVDRSELKDREAIPQRTEQALREALSILERTQRPRSSRPTATSSSSWPTPSPTRTRRAASSESAAKRSARANRQALDELAAVVGA